MKKRTEKRFELVKTYLLKICDRGHHDYYDIQIKLSPEEFAELHEGKAPDMGLLFDRGDAEIVTVSEWDKHLEGRGRSNTAELIQRDVNLFWVVETARVQKKVNIEEAIDIVIGDWTSDLIADSGLGDDAIKQVYKNYAPIFRFLRGEDRTLSFPLRDAATYALREMKVLTGRYPINRPTGILEDIHKILELPFEEDIEEEIAIYQRVRNKAFRVTYVHPLRLKWLSMGDFKDRLENRSEKIRNALEKISSINNYDFKKTVTIYHHYRLIEAEDNGQNRFKVYERMQSDLKELQPF